VSSGSLTDLSQLSVAGLFRPLLPQENSGREILHHQSPCWNSRWDSKHWVWIQSCTTA